MEKPYVIRVSSTKGGVGKSVVAINLAISLQLRGYKTLIVDMDTVNPCVGLYLGMQDVSMGVLDVMRKRANVRNVIITHPATGLHVLPGRINFSGTLPDVKMGNEFFNRLKRMEYKFIIIDTQPGVEFPELLKWYDEALIVINPLEASCIAALKMFKKCGKAGLKASLLANKVGSRRYELSSREIESVCEVKLSGVLPEDKNVEIGVVDHIPTYLLNKRAPFSSAIEFVTDTYSSRIDSLAAPAALPRTGILAVIKGFFRRLGS